MSNPDNNYCIQNPADPHQQPQNFNVEADNNLNNIETPMDDSPVFTLKDTNTRLAFIRKVYSILAVQLIVTAIMIYGSVKIENYEEFIHEYFWVFIPVIIVNLITLYCLVYSKTCSRKVPLNYILLTIFTLTFGFMTTATTAVAEEENVLTAAVMTCAMVVGLTLYAVTTKTDITMCGGLLFMIGMAFVGAMFVSVFIGSEPLVIGLSVLGVLIFGLYIVYDTQLIVGGRQYQLEIDDYILGAMMLYMDIIELFLQILRLLEYAN